MRLSNALVAGLVVGVLASGCGSDPPTPKPMPTPSRTTSSPSVPQPDLSRYSAEKQELAKAAIAELERFDARDNEFIVAGKATSDARAFYAASARDWKFYFDNLRNVEQSRLKFTGDAAVTAISVPAVNVAQDRSVEVRVKRCIDPANVRVTQDGKDVSKPQSPKFTTTQMVRAQDGHWVVFALFPGKPC